MKNGLFALLLVGACASSGKSKGSPENTPNLPGEEHASSEDGNRATPEECEAAIDHMGQVVRTDPGISEEKRQQAIDDLEMHREDLIAQCAKEATHHVVQCVLESKDLHSTARCEN